MVAERGVVLIVEDSPELAELISAIVEREGFTGVAAGSAAAARAAYQRHRPVAVLLDWVLPDAPGTELCRELRAPQRRNEHGPRSRRRRRRLRRQARP